MAQSIEEKLEKIIEDEGINVVFGDGKRNTDVISQAIASALKTYRENRKKDSATPTPAEQAEIDATNELAETMEKNSKSIDAMADATKDLQQATEELKGSFGDTSLFSDAQIQRLMDSMLSAVFDTADTVLENTKQKLEWFEKLEDAGIRFTDGFDNSFTKFANKLQMSHDEFVNHLVSNSQQFTRMNAMGMQNMMRLMDASGNLVGKYGYDAESALQLTSYYSENIAKNLDEEEWRTRNISTEVEILAKNMKALSLATGKSVDMLLKEQEEKEKNLLMTKLARDPLMKQYMSLLENMGLGRDEILGLVTGVPNEKTALLHTTMGGQVAVPALAKIAQDIGEKRITDMPQILDMVRQVQNDPRVQNDVKSLDRMSRANAYIRGQTAPGDALNTVINLATFKLNEAIVGEGNEDETNINRLRQHQAAKNKLLNTHLDKMSLGLDDATWALNKFTKALEAAQSIADITPSWLYMFGSAMISAILTSGIGTMITTKITDKLLMGGWSSAMGFLRTKLISAAINVNTFGGTFKSLSMFGSKLALGLSALSVAAGGLVIFFEDKITKKLGEWFNFEEGSGWWKASKVLTNMVGGALIGFPLGGPLGALAGAIAGGAWGAYEAFFSDEAKAHKNSPQTNNIYGPASTNVYKTSSTSTIQNNTEQMVANNSELIKSVNGVKESVDNSNIKGIVAKDYNNKQLSASGNLYQSSLTNAYAT